MQAFGGGTRRGPAGVECQMGENLNDFFTGQAILLGEADMPGELLNAAQRRQRAERHQAALAGRKRFTRPDIIKKYILTQLG